MTILSAAGVAVIGIVAMIAYLAILVLLANLAEKIFGDEYGCGCFIYLLGIFFAVLTFVVYLAGNF